VAFQGSHVSFQGSHVAFQGTYVSFQGTYVSYQGIEMTARRKMASSPSNNYSAPQAQAQNACRSSELVNLIYLIVHGCMMNNACMCFIAHLQSCVWLWSWPVCNYSWPVRDHSWVPTHVGITVHHHVINNLQCSLVFNLYAHAGITYIIYINVTNIYYIYIIIILVLRLCFYT